MRIDFHPKATDELEKSADYYANRSAAAVRGFAFAVDDALGAPHGDIHPSRTFKALRAVFQTAESALIFQPGACAGASSPGWIRLARWAAGAKRYCGGIAGNPLGRGSFRPVFDP